VKTRIAPLFVKYNVVVMLVVLIVASAMMSDVFLSSQNIWNLLRQLVPLALVSLGMLLVILTGGIDLSVGSVAAIGAMVIAMLLPALPGPAPLGLLLGVLAAMAAGAALGTVTVARGIAFMMSNGQPVRFPRDLAVADLLKTFGSAAVPGIGVPWPVVLAAVAIAVFAVMLSRTKFGRLTIATGSNEVAVRLAGLPVARYKFLVYAIAAGLSALAGVVATSRTAVGTANIGFGLELDAIAACVIGGALLSGGRGSVVNTMIGVIVLGLIGNIMNLMSVPAYPQQVIKGVIIVLAVLLQNVSPQIRRT